MSCDLASVRLDAYFDGGLAPAEQAAVARHVAGCAACAEALGQMQQLRRGLAEDFGGVVPVDLEARIKLALLREAEPAGKAAGVPLLEVLAWPWATNLSRLAAVGLVVAGIAAGIGYDWIVRQAPHDQTVHDVVAAHARAMMQATPYQVAASDPLVVKPWFAGRTEFSPAVADFSAQGYALVGGRLDYINGQRVAALVYKHGAHFIDVFLWPTAGPEADPSFASSGGYQLASWVNDGLEGRCISDISAADMKVFAALIYGKDG